ncbi:MAG: DUF1552 domain-containing protein [Polyangiaceae bacterium]|jgi:hypothetical protein
MNRRSIDRRRFLKLVGATALTYPFLRGLPSYAQAGGGSGTADPIYLVLLFSGCGVVRYQWGAQGLAPTGTTPTVTSPLVFRPTLSAFTKAGPMQADLTSSVTVLDGLSVAAAGQTSHEGGMAALWTGTTLTGTPLPTGPSIDQVIAPLMKTQLNVNTPYPNIPLMAQSSADYQTRDNDTRMLYDANANFVDPYSDPATTLSLLFPGTMATSMSTGPDKTTFIRSKVFAQVQSELSSLQSRLCTEDRQQLQNYQALLNQVQMQIQSAATAAASCTAPSIGDAGAATASGGGPDPFPANVQAMSNILAMSLACDLTRVASLQLSHALSPVTHTWLGSSQTQTHHQYSHIGPSSLYSLGSDLYNEPASVTSTYPQQLIDIDAWYAQQVAALAYTLSQLKTASGKNLLDQTVICWGSELDMGNAHNHDDTPFVLIGGGGGKLKSNQLVRFHLNLLGNNDDYTGNRAHNDLLLTLAQVMGVNVGSTFGTPSFCTGPITQILA